MANNYQPFKSNAIGSSWTTVYTSPAGKKSLVTSVKLTNVIDGNIAVSARILDSSDSDAPTMLGNAIPILVGQLIELIDSGKVVLASNDQLQIKSSTGSSVDLWGTAIEDVS